MISPLESDGLSLGQILDCPQICVRRFPACQEALASLREHPVGVVISNVELPDGCWRDLLEALSGLACPPNLIVASRLADESLWAEVLNLGGYDLLLTPFDPEEVLRVTNAAWIAWKRGLIETPLRRTAASSAGTPAVSGGAG